MDYNTFKTFIHPSVLEAFTTLNKEETIVNAFALGVSDSSALVASLTNQKLPVRFSPDVYSVNKGLSSVYEWVLQDKAVLMNINLSGLGIQESDVYSHFSDLKDKCDKTVDGIRKEAITEAMEDKQPGSGGARLYFAPNRYGGRYRR